MFFPRLHPFCLYSLLADKIAAIPVQVARLDAEMSRVWLISLAIHSGQSKLNINLPLVSGNRQLRLHVLIDF